MSARAATKLESDFSQTVCECGRHYGLGAWTPHQRAQAYYLEYRRGRASDHQFQFLKSWGQHHHEPPRFAWERQPDARRMWVF